MHYGDRNMHYGDKEQKLNEKMIVIVYNHERLGCKPEHRINKDGKFSKRYVDYQITSIQKCENFPPYILKRMLLDPFNFFNPVFSGWKLDPQTNEGFYEIEIGLGYPNPDSWFPKSITHVTHDENPLKQLH